MSALIHLASHGSVASIACRGAELRAWSAEGVPLIWTPDPLVWPETAPILFPVVGWTRNGSIRVAGQSYPLGLHGFARSAPFILVDRGADWACLRLAASPETLQLYPFLFSLDVTYRLNDAALRIELAVRNDGGGPMPYACGLHPGFAWPFDGGAASDYTVTFAQPEDAAVPVVSADGLFTRERRAVPLDGRRLALAPSLFAREALCFLAARSRSLRFARLGGAAFAIDFEGFPHLALWSRPGGSFLSIEAWTGHGDFVDAEGDLWRKPSMIHLSPGASGLHAATYRFFRDGGGAA